jgi:hypothetical protein
MIDRRPEPPSGIRAMNPIRLLALAGALALTAAVATPGTAAAQEEPGSTVISVRPRPSAPAAEERSAPRRRRRDVLTRQELLESGTTNLFEAIDRLRPQWMRGRAQSNLRGGGGNVVVYQNNTQLGGIDVLRTLNPEFAEELRFLDGPTASNTLPGLGSRTVAGAIVIIRPGTTR